MHLVEMYKYGCVIDTAIFKNFQNKKMKQKRGGMGEGR